MDELITALYIVAFSLFIVGLHMLRGPRTAVRGNLVAAAGMAIAVVATLLDDRIGDWPLVILGLAIGTAIGIPAARNVKMTAMPQMVALFNGVGGGAVALISVVEYMEALEEGGNPPLETLIPILFAAIIGSISFWGSNVAFLKLQETLKRGFRIPKAVNGVLAVIAIALAVAIAAGTESELLFWLVLVFAGALGDLGRAADRRRRHAGRDLDPERVHRPERGRGGHGARQHGADRRRHARRRVGLDPHQADGRRHEPLDRQRVLRRPRAPAAPSPAAETDGGTVRSTSAADVAIQLSYARLVVVVPGYGMAVAQAQRAVADLATELEKRGVEVLYGIHPVAGRMPGHMNVLLAEADVPYDQLKEMDDINPEFPRTDVALVIGANDVTNPAARTVAGLADLRDADPRRRQGEQRDRPQALDEQRLRGHRQPALLQREDGAAVRRREGLGRRGARRGPGALRIFTSRSRRRLGSAGCAHSSPPSRPSSLLAAPASAVSPDIVISQVYGGGGNAGATYTTTSSSSTTAARGGRRQPAGALQYARRRHGHDVGGHGRCSGTDRPRRAYYLVQEAAGAGGHHAAADTRTPPAASPMSAHGRQGRARRPSDDAG